MLDAIMFEAMVGGMADSMAYAMVGRKECAVVTPMFCVSEKACLDFQ